MVYDMVAGTVQEFIDYSLIVVTLMIIYYIFQFFTIEGPTKEAKKKAEAERIDAARDWIKGKWDARKKAEEDRVKKNKEDAEKRIRDAEEKRIKDAKDKVKREKQEKETAGANVEHKAGARAKAEKRVKDKITGYLMSVITLIDDCIKHLDKDEIKEANAAFTRVKRRLGSAIRSDVLEELANNTPHLNQAKMLHGAIVQIGAGIQKTRQLSKPDAASLKQINQHLGAIHKEIGELITKIFS